MRILLSDLRPAERLAIRLPGLACLLAVALCGALLPVYRALRTDAVEALRAE